jgi:hypothetical protein
MVEIIDIPDLSEGDFDARLRLRVEEVRAFDPARHEGFPRLPRSLRRLNLQQPDERRLVLLLERDDVEDAEPLARRRGESRRRRGS